MYHCVSLTLSLLSLICSHHFASASSSTHPPFFQDVLKAVWKHKGWNWEDVNKTGDLKVEDARVGISQSYHLHLRIGNNLFLFGSSDDISLWNDLGAEFQVGPQSLLGFAPKPIVRRFQLEGPFELRLAGDHHHNHLILELPYNSTVTGLKRVLVSEGITVRISGAQEVTLFHPSADGLPIKRSLVFQSRKKSSPFSHPSCTPLLVVVISGSASLAAYRIQYPNSIIKTTFLLPNTIELLPDKCYAGHYQKNQACTVFSLCSRISLVEKILQNFTGDRIFQDHSTHLTKAKITAATIVRFQLELERHLVDNNTVQNALEAWRTKPKIERMWFEIVARVGGERLKPLMLKETKPFIALDTTAWSNLMSNVSFTQFPSAIVPPEALTLDIK